MVSGICRQAGFGRAVVARAEAAELDDKFVDHDAGIDGAEVPRLRFISVPRDPLQRLSDRDPFRLFGSPIYKPLNLPLLWSA